MKEKTKLEAALDELLLGGTGRSAEATDQSGAGAGEPERKVTRQTGHKSIGGFCAMFARRTPSQRCALTRALKRVRRSPLRVLLLARPMPGCVVS